MRQPALPGSPCVCLSRQAGHKLYRFRSGFACRNCQRWRAAFKSSFWTEVPCRIARAPVSAVAGHGVMAEAGIDMRGVCLAEGADVGLHDKDGATRRRGGSDLDDSEGSPFWPEEEVAVQSSVVEVASGFDCPPADL